uniref:NADH-quinone oxidoreductase subunit N n=1 Tax=Thauera sp. TaxID=1905334 RepID=UPI00258CAC8D
MNFVVPDFYPAAAEIFVAVMALVIMLASTFARSIARGLSYHLTQATLIAAAFITIFTMEGEVVYTFSNLFISDLMGDFLKLMIYFSTAVALLYGRAYLGDRKIDKPEFYLLALLMTLGMMVMVTANHMLPMYIGLEMMSLALYTMVAFDRDSARSTEAAMKYFVLGALASGLLLYGMSMVYGATGTLEFSAIAQAIYNQSANQTVLMFGLVFLVAGICFKLGVVPFHMWVPDVYQGAPTAVTLVIATA